MNKMTLKSGLFALMTSAALLAPAVYAAGPNNDGGCRHEMRGEHRGYHGDMHKMFRGLELTDAQRSQMKELMQSHREAMQASRPSDEVRAAHKQQMLDMITSDSFNEADAQAMMAQRSERKAMAAVERMKMQRAIYQMLTPEQQAKFKENFANRGGGKGNRP
ncbi:Spy/CpxP family protein refolding chaperone [Shewanella marisflavi]|uniref:Spy/CpxP family protein refolding chaperone n=1 Tax=Shewanella marisflavi TaxID=260364 RepID=UPI003AAB66DB